MRRRLSELLRRVVLMFRRTDIRDEIIREQRAQIADLLDRLQETIGQIHYHQVQRATAEAESVRMHVSEEEEDIRFAHAEGLLDEATLKDKLAELQFVNTDITLG